MLAGRDAERASIAALFEAARGSFGGELVLRGVAGSGKSTLLADAAAAASVMTVWRRQGVESESQLAFAALQRLLCKGVERLPAPQRAASQATFGEAEGESDRFLAFLATLSLLSDAAEEHPILAVVDDAHWLDEASAAALLFVARRAAGGTYRCCSLRAPATRPSFDTGELASLTLGGLSCGESAGARRADRGAVR